MAATIALSFAVVLTAWSAFEAGTWSAPATSTRSSTKVFRLVPATVIVGPPPSTVEAPVSDPLSNRPSAGLPDVIPDPCAIVVVITASLVDSPTLRPPP